MAIMLLSVGVTVLYFLVVCCTNRIKNRKKSSTQEYTSWPIVGMIPDLLRNEWRIHDYTTLLLKLGNGVFHFKGGWIPKSDFVIVSDPMNVHHIFSRNFANYPKGPELREILEPLGDGIFRTDADLWKFQRKLMHEALHDKRFQPFLERCTRQKLEEGLIPIIEHVSKLGLEVDLQDLFQRFTFDTTCRLVFGFDSNSLSVELPIIPHEKAFDDLERISFKRYLMPKAYWKLMRWLQIGDERKFKEAWDVFDRFLYQSVSITRENLSKRKSHMEEEEDFNLVKAFIEQGEGEHMDTLEKSNKFLRDNAFNLMAAGRDTLSACLTWFFLFVATNPSIETKILEEIKEKLQDNYVGNLRIFSAEEINALVYLHATLCETLRLYPPVPFNHKTAVEADVLPTGHSLIGNTRVLVCFYAMGRMQEIWGRDCLDFKPERWISDSGGIIYVPSYKFTAFNAGPRSCLGKDMSFIQMKIIAVSLIWNYHVQLVQGHPISPKNSIVLHMKDGLKVKVTKRFD
ncbi:hypothetical protein Ddye_004564 [Dipteronia dyeriana]|uniref:Cytochrome P450 n=1 Tax=Dipteronia dyeriana TaxID=168575 RepID=A0AAD9XV98_9ROSI|nr:hypothetical protein Ddye_004564 [Dipteronia dyeriana]